MGLRDFFGLNGREEQVVRIEQPDSPATQMRHHVPAYLPVSRTATGLGPKEVVRIGTVYRCVNIISTMVSQMDVKVMRGKKEMSYVPMIVREPIEGESFSSFVQQTVMSLALWGNAYIRLVGSDPERPTSVKVLDPDSVVCSEDEITGKVIYWYKGKVVPSNRIKHLKLDRMPGQLLGHGPLTGASGVIKAAYLLDEFQRTWFDTTGSPKGIINTESQLTQEQSGDLAEAWSNFIETNHGVIVMPKGVGFEPITIKPAEAQYLDVVSQNIRDIARIFGIPASNLLSSIDGTSMTYTNYVESNIMFLQNTLSRYIKEIEDFMSSLLPRGQQVNFDEESLLRLAPEKLWAMKKIQYDVGYYSGAEQREEEGKEPLPELNFDTEGVGANSLAEPITDEELEKPKGETDNVDDLTNNPNETETESGKAKTSNRCINDGKPLDGKETQFCSRKCKDEWNAKNKLKGAV